MSKLLVSAAALIASAGIASAKTAVNDYVLWSDGYKGVTADQLNGSTSRTGQAVSVSVAGTPSWDAFGAPINIRTTLNVGPGGRLTGIGWNVAITALGESWLSEIAVAFGNTSTPQQINLRPGAGSNFPGGPTNFQSSILKFSDVGLPDIVADADGLIRIEFFESFDDAPGVQDGVWNTGTLTYQFIPTPGAAALFGIAGLAAARRRRA